MIVGLVRFVFYVYLSAQFAVLFFIYLKGYRLKPSKFPLYLSLIFFFLAVVFIMLGLLVIIKEFTNGSPSALSYIIIIPTIPLIYFTNQFIKESLPNKK